MLHGKDILQKYAEELHPLHREGGKLERFDRVIANPPFSQNYTKSNMEFPERYRWGWCPTSGKKADLMFAQHMLAVCKPGGMVATVMPHGVLFRGGAEKEIRKKFLQQDLIEAIISLPQNLFYGAGLPHRESGRSAARPQPQRGALGIPPGVCSRTAPTRSSGQLQIIRRGCRLVDRQLAGFQDPDGKRLLMSGNAITRLTLQKIEDFTLPFPEPVEQQMIVAYFNECAKTISAYEAELESYKNIKFGLQDDLLTGQVRVPNTIVEGAAVA